MVDTHPRAVSSHRSGGANSAVRRAIRAASVAAAYTAAKEWLAGLKRSRIGSVSERDTPTVGLGPRSWTRKVAPPARDRRSREQRRRLPDGRRPRRFEPHSNTVRESYGLYIITLSCSRSLPRSPSLHSRPSRRPHGLRKSGGHQQRRYGQLSRPGWVILCACVRRCPLLLESRRLGSSSMHSAGAQ